jgi:hypothetical protein
VIWHGIHKLDLGSQAYVAEVESLESCRAAALAGTLIFLRDVVRI